MTPAEDSQWIHLLPENIFRAISLAPTATRPPEDHQEWVTPNLKRDELTPRDEAIGKGKSLGIAVLGPKQLVQRDGQLGGMVGHHKTEASTQHPQHNFPTYHLNFFGV
jgi:hypothetical protein